MAQRLSEPGINAATSDVFVHGWLAQTWQLVLWNLFHLRRRGMSRWLSSLFFGGYALLLLLTIISHMLLAHSSTPRVGADPIVALAFPGSLQFALGYLGLLAPIFLCIVAGTLVGGDYTYGMHNQMLTRGLGRGQVFTAQVAALALVALLAVGFVMLISTLLGFLIGPLFGLRPVLLAPFGWLGFVLTWLTQSLRYFIYMLIAVLAATIGRSAIAGIGFSVGYVFIEFLATNILFSLVGGLSAPIGRAIVAFVSNLPGTVSNSLNTYATTLIAGQPMPDLDQLPLQLFLTLMYSVILIALSYLIYQHSDIFD
ncbi:hypothetical protein [Dictyobacter formicarum]|uniref:ABC transporter permease n=1 Tax=Dictyobacter formicarum TaxID=2778368 RepID=A0ABQ3VCE3_9CHLR|nr:hypothetical protein [Dictyobacter formicarum]GHO83572.1 hypothetical protein KSZ_15780 [Dictyobacter formicarum]